MAKPPKERLKHLGQFTAHISTPSTSKSTKNGKPRLTAPQSEIVLSKATFTLEGFTCYPELDVAEKAIYVTLFRRKGFGPAHGNTFTVDRNKTQCRAFLTNQLMFKKTGVAEHEITVDVYHDINGYFVLRVPIHHLELADQFKGSSVRES